MRLRRIWLGAGALVIAALLSFLLGVETAPETTPASAGIGDPRALHASYERWKARCVQQEGDRKLVLPLGYSKGLSARFTKAHGQLTLDLADGSLRVAVQGLPDVQAFDVWLIDNRPGPERSVKPEPGDGMLLVGSLKHGGGTARLEARLDRGNLAGFELDLVVITRADEAPAAGGLLFGSPTLFQRLYHSEQRGQLASFADRSAPRTASSGPASLLTAPFRALIPSPAYAQHADLAAALEALVAQGEAIFFNETFKGNGRTCGTCHPAENNFTIDPAFIATLAPKDPLFVAEFNPLLSQNFENPVLMRRFGLILENVDGFDDLENKFVMRGVPHTLALPTSLDPPPGSGPLQRTGWGGDGAPGTGTLREFAIGAVRQHFTKSLQRREGPDFRLPTEEELDALEAFQLSLGRQTDVPLGDMIFTNVAVEDGKALFNSRGCNNCHLNAGANTSFAPGNFNFATGVENFPHPAGLLPRDGGFGVQPHLTVPGAFGDGTFNTPPLVESADTGPFFHNNLVNTIEEAVAFFNSDAFTRSSSGLLFGGKPLLPGEGEVAKVAALLRVLNAVENIRSSASLADRAERAPNFGQAKKLLRLAIHGVDDAIGVLDAGLHPEAVAQLQDARMDLEDASKTNRQSERNALITIAKNKLDFARAAMVTGG